MSRRKEQTAKRRGYWNELYERRPRPMGPFDTVICHHKDLAKIKAIVSSHRTTEVRTSPDVPIGKCYFVSQQKLMPDYLYTPPASPLEPHPTMSLFQWVSL